jgi:hypothetical protein
MEERFDRVKEALAALEAALAEVDVAMDGMENVRLDCETLREYLDSGRWLKDFEADEAGKLPSGLKRGVLSEDGLFNLLEDCENAIHSARSIRA